MPVTRTVSWAYQHMPSVCLSFVQDPLMTWSRVWEYTYVWTAVREAAREIGRPMTVLDMGSGVTFFPFLLASALPGTTVVASDMNDKYPAIFHNIAMERVGKEPVHFHLHDARNPNTAFPNATFDIITSVSVLEHTDDYPGIAVNLHRQLRPGGILVVTFDIATGPGFEVPPAKAAALLSSLTALFEELHPPVAYGYSEQALDARARGVQGPVLDVKFIIKEMPELRAPPDLMLTISCHVFKKGS